MVSLGIQSGRYGMTASSTKRVGNKWSYTYYYPTYGRLYGSSAWMPSYNRFGEYVQVCDVGIMLTLEEGGRGGRGGRGVGGIPRQWIAHVQVSPPNSKKMARIFLPIIHIHVDFK